MPDHDEALFSISRSLWDRVTPNLRGVSYLMDDQSLRVRCMYEGVPGEWEREMVSEAEAECVADFWQTHEVVYVAEHVPIERSRDIDSQRGERWVLLRYEAPLAEVDAH